ncbi:MAG: type II toxin-antitoxin system RelE/ParE family toxin [Planctomycetota bacterium]|nr:MAG: type II toxin-antitoxin system RelE/ParE family toxin [Planctomycetota bacterium]REJ87973.1 MAG: type II toxin-antitoxin system RelE/ParE family toxin [Planctomycetota bacterium]REK23532.1 MAG: type II toxin-antitoxin system RelE/ParE family toxin [Planctomycetota bacterium]REK40411.1 MAG: type II toxin-antitoxin system RelE/ParE family toxin [Planctomycetota bacterium]
MAKLVFARLAEQDLHEILEFISRDKPTAAVRWVEKIRPKCRLLASHPELGERRPEFATGQFRSSLVGSYVIFCRPVEGGIEVARVVRGERDTREI